MSPVLALRPTFEIPVAFSRDEAIVRIATECKRKSQPKIFFSHGEYGELHLPTDQHRLWSPHLTFYVSGEGKSSVIRGRFAPRLEIWTFVWILYLSMAFIAFFAAIMHFSKWSLGEESWWIWGAVTALLAIASIYLSANVGQQWSSDQMEQLRNQLDQILSDSKLTD